MYKVEAIRNMAYSSLAILVLLSAQVLPFVQVNQVGASQQPNRNKVSYWCSDSGVKFDSNVDATIAPVTADFGTQAQAPNNNDVDITVSSGFVVTKVVVKGGSTGGDGFGNIEYTTGPWTDLVSPLNTNSPNPKDTYSISHVIVCYDSVPVKTTIKVVKNLVPTNDSGSFDLLVNNQLKKNNAGHNGTTGLVDISPTSNVVVKEKAGTNATDLDDYTTAVECRNQDDKVVASSNPTGSTSRSLAISKHKISAGDSIVCVFSNTKIPQTGTLKVIKKVVNDDGGSAVASDFSITVNGDDAGSFTDTSPTAGEIVLVDVPIGVYTVIEDDQTGYSVEYENCDKAGVRPDRTTTCYITNDDIPAKLTVVKNLIQDNGATDSVTSFSYSINGGDNIPFTDNGMNMHELKAGDYTVVEDTSDAYTTTYDNCDSTLDVGEQATCTITNDDKQGKLTVYKKVINDNGGNKKPKDFVLTLSQSGQFQQYATSGIAVMLDAGTYRVGELQKRGYDLVGFSKKGDCNPRGLITVTNGGETHCVIVNDDKPGKIVVHKKVINDNGGEKVAKDFEFKIVGDRWQDFNRNGVNRIMVDRGVYTVREKDYKGYETSYKGCKDIKVRNGQTKHCYIVNDDIAPKVIVKKHTYPNYSVDQDFEFELTLEGNHRRTFTLNTATDARKSTGKKFLAGVVDITEQSVDGWLQMRAHCFQKRANKPNVPLYLPFKAQVGKVYVCEFKNAELGSVTVTKFNDENNNGVWDSGEETLTDWKITADKESNCELVMTRVQGPVLCKDAAYAETAMTDSAGVASFSNLYPGAYAIDEVLQDGWVQTALECYNMSIVLEENERMVKPAFVAIPELDDTKTYAHVNFGTNVECVVGNYQEPVVAVEVPEEPQVLAEVVTVEPEVAVLASTGADSSLALIFGLVTIAAAVAISRKQTELV